MIGRLADAVRVAVDGLAYVYSIGHERSVGNVLTANLAEARLGTEYWDGADRALAAALRLGGDYWSHHLYVWSAQLATWRGDLDAADRFLDAGTQALTEPSAAAYHRLVAAERAAWAGDLDTAQRLVDAGLRDTEATGAAFLTVRLAALGLRIEADSVAARIVEPSVAGAGDRGRSLLDRAVAAAASAVGIDAPAWLVLARAEHQRLLAVGEREHWPAIAARWRSAATGWQAAAGAWAALERPYLAAYASWRHAEALVTAGAPAAEATTPARCAYDTAGRLGATALRREVERLATRARLTLEPPPAPHPTDAALAGTLGLTARELEVLRLLGLGYTNRDIADTLTISVKTASVHVTHILRKLGVPGRVQAAAYARRPPSG
jgi:DNA-binding CsgD family transcriptional regulator